MWRWPYRAGGPSAIVFAVSFQAAEPEVGVSVNSPDSEAELVARLRSGDEAAFVTVVDRLHGRLVAMASTFTSSPSLAEDIVQETWLGVIRGLAGFEARSSLSTWIFGILVRRARTIAAREARTAPPPPAPDASNGAPETEWEPGFGRVGLWEGSPVPWALEDPAAIYQSRETLEVVRSALEGLPGPQRQVVLLRDVEGISSQDACNILDLSETNQRVLLHRGRARIRRALDRYVRDGVGPRPLNGTGGTTTPGTHAGRTGSVAAAADRIGSGPGDAGGGRA